jgi:hypothetical protein
MIEAAARRGYEIHVPRGWADFSVWNDPIVRRLTPSIRAGINGLSGIRLRRGSRLNLLLGSAPTLEVPKQPVLLCGTQLVVGTSIGRNGNLAVRVPCSRSGGFLCGRTTTAHYEKDGNVGDPHTQLVTPAA